VTNTTVNSLGIAIPQEDAVAPDWFDPETNDSNFTLATEIGLDANATIEEVEAALQQQTGEVTLSCWKLIINCKILDS